MPGLAEDLDNRTDISCCGLKAQGTNEQDLGPHWRKGPANASKPMEKLTNRVIVLETDFYDASRNTVRAATCPERLLWAKGV